VQDKILRSGYMSLDAFFADLNEGTMARYREAERNGRTVNVYFYGRSSWAQTTTDNLRGDQEQLVITDAGFNAPEEQQQNKRGTQYCRYSLSLGEGNAKALMDELYERQELDERV